MSDMPYFSTTFFLICTFDAVLLMGSGLTRLPLLFCNSCKSQCLQRLPLSCVVIIQGSVIDAVPSEQIDRHLHADDTHLLKFISVLSTSFTQLLEIVNQISKLTPSNLPAKTEFVILDLLRSDWEIPDSFTHLSTTSSHLNFTSHSPVLHPGINFNVHLSFSITSPTSGAHASEIFVFVTFVSFDICSLLTHPSSILSLQSKNHSTSWKSQNALISQFFL